VSGDSIGEALPHCCPSLFSKPRQFPHSGEADNPAVKLASHEMDPSSPEESCLPLLRRVRPAVANVGAVEEADGRVVRMELDKLTAADVEEVTGQSDDDDDDPASKTPNVLSGGDCQTFHPSASTSRQNHSMPHRAGETMCCRTNWNKMTHQKLDSRGAVSSNRTKRRDLQERRHRFQLLV